MFQYKNKVSEYQRYLNAFEIFSKEEIKSLKKLNPELNNLLKYSSGSNNNYNNKEISKDSFLKTDTSKDFSKKLISKKIFYTLILEELKKIFVQKNDSAMSKIISLLINEIITISKIVQENQILNEFFEQIKKDKCKSFSDSKKLFNVEKNLKGKKDINSKSEKHFERFISNGANVFKNYQLKKGKIIKNSSFYDLNNLEIMKDKSTYNNRNFHTENGISISKKYNDINNKNNSDIYYSIKKIKINEKRRNNKNNKSNSKSNNKIYNNSNSKSLILMDNINSNTEPKISDNKNKVNNYTIKKRLNIGKEIINKKPKKSFDKNDKSKKNKEIKTQDFSIINFINSNSDVFNGIETENFDIFELDKKAGRENVLPLIGYYIFNRLGFHDIINYNRFEKWCIKINEGYSKTNSYHTNIHAADVTQTCLIYFKLGKINEICNLTKNSKCSVFLSCICHDFKHPGVNNNFLKETKDPLALLYNDASILENMHLAETFKLINSNETYNIFDKVDSNTYKQFRKEMISCVLATDMAFHSNYVNFMKVKIDDIKKEGQNNNKNDDYQNYMNLLVHSADISNPTKPFDIYFKWAKLVVNEFYNQGDQEKKLGMNCSCDRDKVTIYQSQLGFINFIELPYFSLFMELFPKLKFYNDQLISNKSKLISMEEEEKKKNDKNSV